MLRKKITSSFLGIILILGFSYVEASVKFTYNPPDGTKFVETVRTKRIKDMGKHGSVVDESIAVGEVTILKTTAGYKITAVLLSMKMTRNGKSIEDPISKLLINNPISYHIDQEGQLKTIVGYDKVVEKMKATFPPQVVKALSGVIN